MRVLTVRQPWAWAIMHGKSPENRTQLWSYTGPVGVHAGTRVDVDAFRHPAILDALARLGYGHLLPEVAFGTAVQLHTAAVLGVAQMIGGHRGSDDCCPGNLWADRTPGVSHLALTRPRPFLTPIPGVRGALGLWKPGDDLMHRMGGRLAELIASENDAGERCGLGHLLDATTRQHALPADLMDHDLEPPW